MIIVNIGKIDWIMLKVVKILVAGSIFLSSVVSVTVCGQMPQQEGKVKYTPDFKFKDGIYLNFDQVKANTPIPKAKLLTSADYNDREFFNKVFESGKIYFYDEMGIRQEVDKSNIWGFARNGVLYVSIQDNFNRITFVGSICHFVADITTYDSRYNNYSPYGYYDPYSLYYPYSYGSYYPYGSYYSPYRQQSIARNELKQYIFDFETGKILEFTTENVQILLMKDPALYDEYVQLSRKKKKELMFVYIRKFNEKNPLYLPVR
jgi:hypothetical protein